MLNLSMVDTIIIDCVRPKVADLVLNHCKKEIKFNRSIIFTHEHFDSDNEIIIIDKIDSIEKYSDFVLTIGNYIDNNFVLIMQTDGFILNPKRFSFEFLNYDYIGAPFDAYIESHNVGNGGFSLRSKQFLNYSNQFETTNGAPEDRFLTIDNYHAALACNINFAPNEIASIFSMEHPMHTMFPNFDPNIHFGFHGRFLFDKIYQSRPDFHELLNHIC